MVLTAVKPYRGLIFLRLHFKKVSGSSENKWKMAETNFGAFIQGLLLSQQVYLRETVIQSGDNFYNKQWTIELSLKLGTVILVIQNQEHSKKRTQTSSQNWSKLSRSKLKIKIKVITSLHPPNWPFPLTYTLQKLHKF